MGPSLRACLVAVGAIVVSVSLTGARGDDPPAPRVRGTNLDAAQLLEELVARSPTARELVDRLNQSDMLIYVRYRAFSTMTLRGHIGLLSFADHRRLFAIEIDPRHTLTDRLVALAHELRHAVEIADASSVWDAQSMAALYEAIGDLTSDAGGQATYETMAATDTGRQVRSELTTSAAANDAAIRN
jgi:hypothetical protein